MEHYKNLGGQSNVTAYEIGEDSITVEFGGGETYLYTAVSASPVKIAEMQRLAKAGRGLNGFIARSVKNGYQQKIR